MEPENVVNALANEARVKTLRLILSEPKTASVIHEEYLETYNDDKHRETVYRYLETLVDAGLVEKEYQSGQGLVYSVAHRWLVLDLEDWVAMSVDEMPKDLYK